jgi:hypothetical protein
MNSRVCLRSLTTDPGVDIAIEAEVRARVQASEGRLEPGRLDFDLLGRDIKVDLDAAPEGELVPFPVEDLVPELGGHVESPVIEGERPPNGGFHGPSDLDIPHDGIDRYALGPSLHPARPDGEGEGLGRQVGPLDVQVQLAARPRGEIEAAADPAHRNAAQDEPVARDIRPDDDHAPLAAQLSHAPGPSGPRERKLKKFGRAGHIDIGADVQVDLRVAEVLDLPLRLQSDTRPFDGEFPNPDVLSPAGEAQTEVAMELHLVGKRCEIERVRLRLQFEPGPPLRKEGPELRGFDGDTLAFVNDGPVPDEPPRDGKRKRHGERSPPGPRLQFSRADVDLRPLEEYGDGLLVPDEGGERKLDPHQLGPEHGGIRQGAQILDDDGGREIGHPESPVPERLPDLGTEFAEKDVLSDDQAAEDEDQDGERDGETPHPADKALDVSRDPEMEMEPHLLIFLQSLKKRSMPTSVSGWRTSFSMTA